MKTVLFKAREELTFVIIGASTALYELSNIIQKDCADGDFIYGVTFWELKAETDNIYAQLCTFEPSKVRELVHEQLCEIIGEYPRNPY